MKLARRNGSDADNARALMWWHLAAIVLHVVSGSLGAVVVSKFDPHVPVVVPLVKFEKDGTASAYMSPRPHVLFRASALWPLVAVEFITAFFHVLYIAQLYSAGFRKFVHTFAKTNSMNALRWYEYGITATLMMAFGSVALGANDFYYFLKLVTNGVALQALGYCIELLDHSPAGKRVFFILFYVIGFNLNLVNVAVLLTQVFASDTGSAKTYFAVNAIPLAFWFQTFGVLAGLAYKKVRIFKYDHIVEEWYIILSLSTKITVFWVEFATFRQVLEDNGAPRLGVNWDALRYIAFTAPFLLVFTCMYMYRRLWAEERKNRVDPPLLSETPL